MLLKNRFKNRFISREKFIEWFTARDFRAGIWARESNPHKDKNLCITVKKTAKFITLTIQ